MECFPPNDLRNRISKNSVENLKEAYDYIEGSAREKNERKRDLFIDAKYDKPFNNFSDLKNNGH